MHHTSSVLKLFALDVLKKQTNKNTPHQPQKTTTTTTKTRNIDGPEPVHVEL